MSYEFTAFFKVREAVMSALTVTRVTATTTNYLERYKRMLAEFEQQHFDEYIPDQMDRLRSTLKRAQQEMQASPFEARTISKTIQNFIYEMRPLARDIKHQRDEAERERMRREDEERKAQKTEAMNTYYEAIKQIKDAAVQNAARPDLATLRSKIVSGTITSAAQVKSAMDSIVVQAQQKAEVFKQQVLANAKREGVQTQIAQAKEDLQQETINSKAKEEQLKTLDEILNRSKESPVEDLQNDLQNANEALLKQKISEDELLEATKYVCETLKAQGYNIPEEGIALEEVNGEKCIRVYGIRNNGDDALCEVTDGNKIRFANKNQEFTMCLKDKENFGSYLQQAYSIDISDDRVIWENPDKISKGEKDIPNAIRRNA